MPVRKVGKQQHIPVHYRRKTRIFKRTAPETIKCDNAQNIMINSNFNRFDRFVFCLLDFFNPFINKYPKLETKLLSICEKSIRFSKKFM